MKKGVQAKSQSFFKNSKNAIIALLLIAAAISVYGLANAAVVSHRPSEIQPQGTSSGLNADQLDEQEGSYYVDAAGGSGSGSGNIINWGLVTATATSGLPLLGLFPGANTDACPEGYSEVIAGYGPKVFKDSAGTEVLSSLDICTSYDSGSCSSSSYTSGSITTTTESCYTCRVCAPSSKSIHSYTAPISGTTVTVVFGTTQAYNGNLGGRSGADTKCQAQIPTELSGKVTNVKALISVSSSDSISNMHSRKGGVYASQVPLYYFDRDWGSWTLIASDWKAFLSGASFDFGEKWTGSDAYGNVIPNGVGYTTYPSFSYSCPGGEYAVYCPGINVPSGTPTYPISYQCNGWTTAVSYATDPYYGMTTGVYNGAYSSRGFREGVLSCGKSLPLLCAAKYTG
jgi:hypothetical protein